MKTFCNPTFLRRVYGFSLRACVYKFGFIDTQKDHSSNQISFTYVTENILLR